MEPNVRTVTVRGVLFARKHQDGDYAWMVRQPKYRHTLFLTCENFLDMMSDLNVQGGGTACLRPVSFHALSDADIKSGKVFRALGIPTGWSTATGGFPVLDRHYARRSIDLALERLSRILDTYTNINEVVFSCDKEDPRKIGTGIFATTIGSDVVAYISEALQNITKRKPTRLSFKQIRDFELRLLPYALLNDCCVRQARKLTLFELKIDKLTQRLQALEISHKQPTAAKRQPTETATRPAKEQKQGSLHGFVRPN